jgi:hypothetical protein
LLRIHGGDDAAGQIVKRRSRGGDPVVTGIDETLELPPGDAGSNVGSLGEHC